MKTTPCSSSEPHLPDHAPLLVTLRRAIDFGVALRERGGGGHDGAERGQRLESHRHPSLFVCGVARGLPDPTLARDPDAVNGDSAGRDTITPDVALAFVGEAVGRGIVR